MPLREFLSSTWDHIHGNLFPWLTEELGPLSETHKRLISTLELVGIMRSCAVGPVFPEDRRHRCANQEAAERLTNGNKTAAVALAMRRLLEQEARAGPLFGVHRGSVRVREGIDLVAPAVDVEADAETSREIDR